MTTTQTSLDPSGVYWIMLRKKGEKRYTLHLASRGETRLKIHACQFRAEDAQRVLADIVANNPEFEFRATLVPPRARIL